MRISKIISSAAVLTVFALGSQKSAYGQANEAPAKSASNYYVTIVPELLDSKILAWDFKDFDILQNQTFFVPENQEPYAWIPKIQITGIKQSSVNRQVVEVSRAVQNKSSQITALLMKEINGEDPAVIEPQIRQKEAEMNALFASLGITDESAPRLVEKFQALYDIPLAHLEVHFAAQFLEEAEIVIKRYSQEFEFSYTKSKPTSMYAYFNGNGVDEFRRASVDFDETSQTGVLSLDFMHPMDGNFGPKLLSYSAAYNALSSDGKLLATDFLSQFEGACIDIGADWKQFSLCNQ